MYGRYMGHGYWRRLGDHGGRAPHGRHTGYGRSWGGYRRFRRRYWTRDERIAWLEEYLGGLEAEALAVRERLAELRAMQPEAEEPQAESQD